MRPRTISTLRERLRAAVRAFGDVPLRDLEHMTDELAGWAAVQPQGVRYARVAALRQALDAAVRWRYMRVNPAKLVGRNRQPPPRAIRVLGRAEIDAIAAELHPRYAPLPVFAAATGRGPRNGRRSSAATSPMTLACSPSPARSRPGRLSPLARRPAADARCR